jgi:hypothetical protein
MKAMGVNVIRWWMFPASRRTRSAGARMTHRPIGGLIVADIHKR